MIKSPRPEILILIVAAFSSRLTRYTIVRPSAKTPDLLAEEGPDVIQAGAKNFTAIGLRQGFAGHPHAWNDDEVEYYAHAIPKGRI